MLRFTFIFATSCLFQSNAAFGQKVFLNARSSTVRIPTAQLGAVTVPPIVSARKAGDEWVPLDVDQAIPPVTRGVTCSLPDVLSNAGENVQDLIRDLDRYSATEVVQHQGVRSGHLLSPETHHFNYVATFKGMPSGYLDVEEDRRGKKSSDQFPEGVATIGTPTLILIFHPLYARGFNMECEGLGEWRGQPAWQVRFEELPGFANHMFTIDMNGKSYGVRFHGRAWILADSYQVAALQTDLAEPIDKIHLRLYHQENEYGPVHFPENDSEIWLPLNTQLYIDFSHHRFYRRHTFMDFHLFSVKVRQVFSSPM